MTKPKSKRAAQRAPNNTFYSDTYTLDELALIALFVTDPTPDDELWLQRVFNRRLAQRANVTHPDGQPITLSELLKVAEALARGTGRVARLLRDKRALSGDAADGIAGAIAAALDELTSELGLEL